MMSLTVTRENMEKKCTKIYVAELKTQNKKSTMHVPEKKINSVRKKVYFSVFSLVT